MLRADLASNQQYQRNVADAHVVAVASPTRRSRASSATSLQRARDLVIQGANGTPARRTAHAIATELTS